jgi:hypothetical protein
MDKAGREFAVCTDVVQKKLYIAHHDRKQVRLSKNWTMMSTAVVQLKQISHQDSSNAPLQVGQ